MNDISIIIVSWNSRKYLLQCLNSLSRERTNLKIETIVVDNASTDGSPQAVSEFFPEVKLVLSNTNQGFARANNMGIRLSTGKYVCLINSDVLVLEGCLPRMFNYMESHPLAGVLGPMALNPDMTLQRTCRKFPSLAGSFFSALGLSEFTYLPHDGVRDVEVLSGFFMMVRRDALNQIGLLDGRFFFYAEDKDWCKRFRDAGWKIVYYPDSKAIHYGGSSSAAAPVKYYIEMHRANLQYWEKHRGIPAKWLYLAIIFIHQAVRLIKGSALYLLKPSERPDTAHKLKRSAACLRWLFSTKETGRPDQA